jgi:branched-chain amino acid transport system permease protein
MHGENGIRGIWARVPPAGRLAAFVGAAALVPLTTDSDYVMRVGVNTLIYALLALGLNVVVGFAGLLDLGYVAFYGFGAYSYALLASEQFDVHWSAAAIVPLVVVASALLGILVGLPSRRLFGDYLAIVTLFFGTIFVLLVTNANRITPPGFDEPVDISGGPNGIAGIDNFDLLAFEVDSVRGYFYLALAVFTLVTAALHQIAHSRIGRAWRALRDDEFAAQLLGMPVNRLKLLAFACGAAVAGLTGTVFAAVQNGVFPSNFDLALLITIYAMVILGGVGSIPGVVMGVITVNVALEVLRTPSQARLAFYALVLAGLFAWLQPWLVAAVVAGTAALGFALHGVLTAAWPSGTRGVAAEGGWAADALEGWMVLLTSPRGIGNAAYGVLLASVCGLALSSGRRRAFALVPVLYLAAFVWENRLVADPSITRMLLLGALLIALMSIRPHGLLGAVRSEPT